MTTLWRVSVKIWSERFRDAPSREGVDVKDWPIESADHSLEFRIVSARGGAGVIEATEAFYRQNGFTDPEMDDPIPGSEILRVEVEKLRRVEDVDFVDPSAIR